MIDEEIRFEETTIEVLTNDGTTRIVPCMIHPKAPGLCVTMMNIGKFNVTHVQTTKSLSDSHERVYNAAWTMAEMQKVANENEFSWDCGPDEVKEFMSKISDKDKSILLSMRSSGFNEFPWEDEHPCDKAAEILMGDDITCRHDAI